MDKDAVIRKPLEEREQRGFLEAVFNDADIFFTVLPVLAPRFFDAPYNDIVQFVLDHYDKYKVLPEIKFINTKFDENFAVSSIAPTGRQFVCDVIEKHCQLRALSDLIVQSIHFYDAGSLDIGSVWKDFQELNQLTITKDIGLEQFVDADIRIRSMHDREDRRTTGWANLDEMLDRGISRGAMLIAAASTAAGKSLFLANVAYNFAQQQLDGVIVSLELNQNMIAGRLDSIITGIEPHDIYSNIDRVVAEYAIRAPVLGRIITKKLRHGSTANTLRNYILEYYMRYKKYPDFCCLDYLDLVAPVARYRNDGAFDRDKAITEEVRDVFDEFGMYGITASQLNRSAVDVIEPNLSHIAGGLSKANTADAVIAIVNVSEDEEFDTGERRISLLKIRSGKRHPKPITLWLDNSLRFVESKPTINFPKHTMVAPRAPSGLSDALSKRIQAGVKI